MRLGTVITASSTIRDALFESLDGHARLRSALETQLDRPGVVVSDVDHGNSPVHAASYASTATNEY
jgi:hypothetical protein